jgi:hypothetical protein
MNHLINEFPSLVFAFKSNYKAIRLFFLNFIAVYMFQIIIFSVKIFFYTLDIKEVFFN